MKDPLYPNWLVGFTEAEGCFYTQITKSKTHKSGYQVKLVFIITQHSRDLQLMENLVKYLGCGKIEVRSKDIVEILITKLSAFL